MNPRFNIAYRKSLISPSHRGRQTTALSNLEYAAGDHVPGDHIQSLAFAVLFHRFLLQFSEAAIFFLPSFAAPPRVCARWLQTVSTTDHSLKNCVLYGTGNASSLRLVFLPARFQFPINLRRNQDRSTNFFLRVCLLHQSLSLLFPKVLIPPLHEGALKFPFLRRYR